MNRVRIIAGGLLLLTGVLHIIQISLAELDTSATITVAFGIVYLIIGALLFRSGKTILYFGAAIPLIGLLLAVGGMFMNPTALGAVFIAIDIAVIACCAYLILNNRKAA